MKFRTEVFPEATEKKISYQTPVLLTGSCFTQNIGNKLADLKFPVMMNPFGVLYNPFSVSKSFEIIANQQFFHHEDLGYFNNQYFSFYHHTVFSSPNSDECLKNINTNIHESHAFLNNAQFVFISLGTAKVYEYKQTGRIVSNCHKIPAREFNHRFLELEECLLSLQDLVHSLHDFNNSLQVIFTVSPVRHWKDGAVENQLSKSILFYAVHETIKSNKHCTYFPSYEIMMDDLRDYRFYDSDLLHPNEMGIQYIWEKFSETFIDNQFKELMNDIEEIIKAYNHRPFNKESPAYLNFVKKYADKVERIIKQYPGINLSEEAKYFNSFQQG